MAMLWLSDQMIIVSIKVHSNISTLPYAIVGKFEVDLEMESLLSYFISINIEHDIEHDIQPYIKTIH